MSDMSASPVPSLAGRSRVSRHRLPLLAAAVVSLFAFLASCSSPGASADAGAAAPDAVTSDAASDLSGPDVPADAGDAPCAPHCSGKECGTDGCGGTCGSCEPQHYCSSGTCKAPTPVSGLAIEEGDATLTLSWKHPDPVDTAGAVVVRSTAGFPSDPLDGEQVFDGTGSGFEDSGLTNNTPYYYAVFAVFDGLVAAPAFVAGVPGAPGPDEWPNVESRACSDPWLALHHRDIRVMRPRILAINYVNYKSQEQMHKQLSEMASVVALSSRWHGYADADAPAFLQPELAYEIDLRDAPGSKDWGTYGRTNSSRYPRETQPKQGYWGFDYGFLFTQEFADQIRIEDPSEPGRFLQLCELLDLGFVHEVWVYGDADHPLPGDFSAAEILELKPVYDAVFSTTGKLNSCAGNGCFDAEDVLVANAAGCSRTVRIAWFNNTRGPGCFLESLSHGFESMASGISVPYLHAPFKDFANMELDADYPDQAVPVNSWYGCGMGDVLSYPQPDRVEYTSACSGPGAIVGYDPVCGNVHFMPDGKGHYDLTNTQPVDSSCTHFRDGTGQKEIFTRSSFSPAYEAVGDCMGPFLVWWRQSFPGLDSSALEDDGVTPMRNWWPFVYY